MISWNKSAKEIHCDILLKFLWTGQVDDALTYLKSVTPKNQKKYDELITYLTKHKTEIINYKAVRMLVELSAAAVWKKGWILLSGAGRKIMVWLE